jgi:hypothetical protein
MAFKSFAAIGRSAADRGAHWQYIYKATSPAPGTAGFFVDLNQSSGVPKYNPFAGSALTLTPLEGLGNLGVYAGAFLPDSTKHLLRWQMLTTGTPPDYVFLLDYLGFYPLIDTDDPDIQVMDNAAPLPRYGSGQVVLITQSPLAATVPITLNYVNQDGESRTSTANIVNGASIGVVVSGNGSGVASPTPFFPLANNDTGVARIESIQMGGGAGGFICAAIVHPVANLALYEASVPSERQFGLPTAPEIKPGACLNFIIHRTGTASAAYQGELLFINS